MGRERGAATAYAKRDEQNIKYFFNSEHFSFELC
jgi:hypothetical protein